jgi:hypothetical protein
MQMQWIILLLCNSHAQDNIFHLILFKNAITRLFWFYAIPSCLGYISYYLIEQLQYPMDTLTISYPTNLHMHYFH